MYTKRLSLYSCVFLLLWSVNGYSQTAHGIWINREEIAALPMSGAAWDRLKSKADQPAGTPNLADQDQMNNVYVLAKALVYARTGIESYRTEVIEQCMLAIDTELGAGGRTLSLGRELAAYVIAADLVGLPADKNEIFKAWLRRTLTEVIDSQTLTSTNERRPNNWGLHAGASRAAVALYLGEKAELDRTAQVFKGWLGDRSVYAGFSYGELSWQCDSSKPVGINAPGCRKESHSIDGVLPDDQRRGGTFTWPPPKENYVYEALQGAIVQAEILRRAGYDAFNWSDKALLRAFLWLHDQALFPAEGDDIWQPHIINFWYGSTFPAPVPTQPGKNIGYSDWTHGPGRARMPLTPTDPGSPSPTPAPAPAPAPTPDVTTRVQQDNAAATYTGTWYTDVLSRHSGGTAARSLTAGSRVTFAFIGTSVKWIAYRDRYSGIAKVYIDGVYRMDVDLHSSQVQAAIGVYTASGLNYAAHTLTIEVTGRKHNGSKGRWIWIDAFEYTAPASSALSIDAPVSSGKTTVYTVAAPSSNELQTGYGLVNGGRQGYGLIQRRDKAMLMTEAAIPASLLMDSGRVAVELNSITRTGLAIANPNAEPNIIEFYFTDEAGVDSAHGVLTIAPGTQLSKFLNEAPFYGTSPFHGTLTFFSTMPVGVTTLRGRWNERSEFSISTMPVVELSPLRAEHLVIPHFAFGRGWNMRIVMINPTDETLSGVLEMNPGPTFAYSIAPRAERHIDFSGEDGELRTGSARIVPASESVTPSAVATFSYRAGGVTLTEASIQASRPAPAFQVDIESNGPATRAGLAVFNDSDETTTVYLHLADANSPLEWQATRTFAPRQRIALYLDEIAEFGLLPSNFRGILRVSSSSNTLLSALGLRTRYNERGDLLLSTTITLDERLRNPNSSFVIPHFAAGSGYDTQFLVFGQPLGEKPLQLFDHNGRWLSH